MNWKVRGFDEKAWDDIKRTIAKGDFCTEHSDYFGHFICGALCFDIILRDIHYSDGTIEKRLLCADAYLLGWDTGYGYTKRGTPYEEGDGFCLECDLNKSFDETLVSFTNQIDDATQRDKTWTEYANKTDITWEKEE